MSVPRESPRRRAMARRARPGPGYPVVRFARLRLRCTHPRATRINQCQARARARPALSVRANARDESMSMSTLRAQSPHMHVAEPARDPAMPSRCRRTPSTRKATPTRPPSRRASNAVVPVRSSTASTSTPTEPGSAPTAPSSVSTARPGHRPVPMCIAAGGVIHATTAAHHATSAVVRA